MDLAALLPHILAPEDESEAASASAAAAVELARVQQAEELRAQLAAEFEQRLAEFTETHQQEMQAARRDWCETEAAELASAISTQIESAANQLADAVSRLLLPVIDEEVHSAAIADLCGKIQLVAAGDLKAAIKLEGPQDLVDNLSRALATEGFGAVEAEVRDGALQARVGESRLISRLDEWLAGLKETVHG